MLNFSLKKSILNYLDDFDHQDSQNAVNVRNALEKLPQELDNDEIITWWKGQDITWIISLQSYMFWMWTTKKIEYSVFEKAYETLTPLLSRSWQMPIEITDGLDLPLLDGGFLKREFSIFQY